VTSLSRLREEFEELAAQKRVEFADLDRMINRIIQNYGHFFPRYHRTERGSRVVHHFNVEDVYPVIIEREHRGRDCVPPRFAKRVLEGIEAALIFVEKQL
jgi:hypothetical protein